MSIEEKENIQNIIYKRIRKLGLLIMVIFLLLSLKLYKIMMIDGIDNEKKAVSQMFKPIKVSEGFELLGNIYDRNMKKFNNTSMGNMVIIHPGMVYKKLQNNESKYRELLNIICDDNDKYTYDGLLNKIKTEYDGSQGPILLDVSQSVRDKIIEYNLPGIFTVEDEGNDSYDKVASPVTAIFKDNTVNDSDLKYDDSIDMKIFNLISGYTSRVVRIPVDGKGNTLPGLSPLEYSIYDIAEKDSKDVVLTLDYDIQKIAEDTLSELCSKNAAVSIIDIMTGGVAAMATKDEKLPERNMLTYASSSFGYNPGSVFKTIVLAAALEEGKVDYDTKYFCSGRDSKYGIKCSKSSGHGLIGLQDAFSLSCNVFFIELAQDVGPEKIIEMAQRFGFGEKVLNFANESRGMLYQDIKNVKHDTGSIAIGQKDILVTPLQVCSMMATIANDGVCKKPYILEKVLNPDGSAAESCSTEEKRIISKKDARIIQGLLKSVVDNGTGKSAKIEEGAAGKTGTPQRGVKMENGRYQHEDGWFAGYFPYENPMYAVAVYVEDIGGPEEGGNISPSIFKAIAQRILEMKK